MLNNNNPWRMAYDVLSLMGAPRVTLGNLLLCACDVFSSVQFSSLCHWITDFPWGSGSTNELL